MVELSVPLFCLQSACLTSKVAERYSVLHLDMARCSFIILHWQSVDIYDVGGSWHTYVRERKKKKKKKKKS
jgi:hypothetical protein